MDRFVLNPAVEPERVGVPETGRPDCADKTRQPASRALGSTIRALARFVAIPRSKGALRSFLRERGVDTSKGWFDAMAPLLRNVDAVGGSSQASWYDRNAKLRRSLSGPSFMNHGYAGSAREALEVLPADRHIEYNIMLIQRLMKGVRIDGRSVLDIGCGLGGTCSFLTRYHRPARVVGLDISPRNVAHCRRNQGSALITFVEGDAHRLPFDARTFQIVTNVESSHCYPSPGLFFQEVWRVLKRQGQFCYTDCMPPAGRRRTKQMLVGTGFRVIREYDATENVRRALARCAPKLRERLESEFVAGTSAHVSNIERSINEVALQEYTGRAVVYPMWVLQKP